MRRVGGDETNPCRVALLVGSPREGLSTHLAGLLEQGVREAGAACDVFALSRQLVHACDGCDGCRHTGVCVKTVSDAAFINPYDDFGQLERMLKRASVLVIVTPVYFAGPPSQLKAVYDRFQSLWARRYVMGEPAPIKRPAVMFVLGEGGDPFGYGPLVTITRSATNIAGFALGEVRDFIGYGVKQSERVATTRSVAHESDDLTISHASHESAGPVVLRADSYEDGYIIGLGRELVRRFCTTAGATGDANGVAGKSGTYQA